MLRGRAGGISDAQEAETQVRACGLAGIPIYFAADWDATAGQQGQINAYLDGAASVIGRCNVGCYGGFWPLSRARAAGKAAYWWGTVAWSGGNWDSCGWQPHIMQGGLAYVGGVECDWDTANFVDYGQWPRPNPPPAPERLMEDDMILVTCREVVVPAGTPWPGVFLLFSDGSLGHVTPRRRRSTTDQLSGGRGPGPSDDHLQEYLARGGGSTTPPAPRQLYMSVHLATPGLRWLRLRCVMSARPTAARACPWQRASSSLSSSTSSISFSNGIRIRVLFERWDQS